MSLRTRFQVGLSLILIIGTSGLGAEALRAEKLAEMDVAIAEAIANDNCPGGVLWLERNGTAYHKAFGHRVRAWDDLKRSAS